MSDLAKRAVACKGWRWRPGMLGIDSNGRKWRKVGQSWVGEDHGIRTCRGELLPDLSDPCTLGGLLALVREAWGFQAFVTLTSGGWHVWGFPWEPDLTSSSRLASGPTEAAALVAALEAAP